jgi:hypothetical protein
VHFRIRAKAIQVIRTAYDSASKRATSRVLGRIERDTLEPTKALKSACTTEERREVAAWIDHYRRSGAVNREMPAGTKEGRAVNRRRAGNTSKRTALIVLGAHRSGTSALTRVLNLAGAYLPEKLLPPIPGNNERGFWEPVELVGITERALADAGIDWSSPRRIETGWFSSESAEHTVFEMVRFLDRNFSGRDLFVIKDPRLCRLVPLLRMALARCDIEGRYILTLRHPSAVAASLEARDNLPLAYGRAVWLRYMLDAEEFTRGSPRLWLDDGDVIRDWSSVVRKVSRHFDVALHTGKPVVKAVSAYLEPSLVHHFGRANERMPALVQAAWIALRDLRAGNNKKSLAELDRVRAALDCADEVLGAAFSWEVKVRMRYEQQAKQVADAREELAELRAVQAKNAPLAASQAQALAKHQLSLQRAEDALAEAKRESEQRITRLGEALESKDKAISQLTSRLQDEAMRGAVVRLLLQQARARFDRRYSALEQRFQFMKSMGQAVLERAFIPDTGMPAGAVATTSTADVADRKPPSATGSPQ